MAGHTEANAPEDATGGQAGAQAGGESSGGAGAGESSGGGGLEIKPMEQFEISGLFRSDGVAWYTVTNATLWMALTVLCTVLVLVVGTRGRAIVPSRAQSVAEMTYGFIYKMIEDVTGKEGLKFFPAIMTLWMFILFANVLGLIPASFTVTSHIAVTAVLALAVFIGVTALGFIRKGPAFLKLFWVEEAPLVLRPLLAVIEIISYFVRPVSHSVRLAGNLMAGHAVIKVFAGFASALGIFAFLPILAIVAIYGLEVLVAVIQAYIFVILTCVYMRDALGDHGH